VEDTRAIGSNEGLGPGLPAAASLQQSIVLAQQEILRRLQR
jgi:hypothetical protein